MVIFNDIQTIFYPSFVVKIQRHPWECKYQYRIVVTCGGRDREKNIIRVSYFINYGEM